MEEIQTYINNKGRVICFPAFTSTSILNNAYYPFFQASQNSIQTIRKSANILLMPVNSG